MPRFQNTIRQRNSSQFFPLENQSRHDGKAFYKWFQRLIIAPQMEGRACHTFRSGLLSPIEYYVSWHKLFRDPRIY